MNKAIKIVNILKWFAFIGLLEYIFNEPFLRLFSILYILFLVDFFYNFRFNIQCLVQLITLPVAYLKNRFRLPSKEDYSCKGDYILPFEGEWSVINGGVHRELSHSWHFPSQRYAYDFIIIDEQGRSFDGSFEKPENYYCYGKKIIAPEDGVVVYVYDKCEDSKIYGNGKVDSNIKDLYGNNIVIKHNETEYSLIAHIMANSILVNVGQNVKKGDPLARCGNTGNSSEPHIHFQLTNSKSPYTSAGIPIEFNNISIKNKPYYKLFDERPVIIKGNDSEKEKNNNSKYIQRGQTVENR